MKRITLWMLLALASAALAGETDLQRATRLRTESGKDWEAERFGDAAQKLTEAARIYEQAEGDHLVDWAAVMRALVWNLMKAQEDEAALEAFERLVKGADRMEEVAGDLNRAYSALWWLADRRADVTAIGNVMQSIRRVLVEAEFEKMAAQAIHDQALLTCKYGDLDRGLALYREAVDERTRIDDLTGRTWSLCNMAASLLDAKRFEDARPPLLKAYSGVHVDGCAEPHTAVAFNVRRELDYLLEETDQFDKASRDWLRALIAIGTKSRLPHIVSVDYLQRTALLLAQSEKDALDEAKRTARLKLASAPPEVSAGLKLCAARRALGLERPKDAARWIKGIDAGSEPVGQHLAARAATLNAWCLAWSKKANAFPDAMAAALDLWTAVGDTGGLLDAASLFEEAIKDRGREEECAAMLERIAEMQRQGRAGSLGGVAKSGGADRNKFNGLSAHDPVFTIAIADGKVRITDRVADRTHEFDFVWQPRNIAINGVSLTIHGGYVVVKSVAYGGGASTGSSPNLVTLGKLGDYHPLPASGVLAILKNGSVTYLPE